MMSRALTELALVGGAPVYRGDWPRWPQVMDLDKALLRLSDVLQSTQWTLRAPSRHTTQAEQFERAWAAHCGTRYALTVTSGSAALELALRGLGIRRGDEVIVPALGWYATAAAVCRVGATPVFADIIPHTTCIDPQEVQRCISPRTAAIIAVHLHCAVADMETLLKIAASQNIPLIEDAAQAHGGAFQGRHVGSIGSIGCFSFNQEKLIPIGEGGAVVTNDPGLFRRMYALRTDGYRPLSETSGRFTADGTVQGNNLCLSEIQAALLLEQLDHFDELNSIRSSHAKKIDSALAGISAIRTLATSAGTTARPFYEYGFNCYLEQFGDWPLQLIADALSAELQMNVHPTDEPVETCPQFAPPTSSRALSRAQQVYEQLLVFHHRYLLSPDIMSALPTALLKVTRLAQILPSSIVRDHLARCNQSRKLTFNDGRELLCRSTLNSKA